MASFRCPACQIALTDAEWALGQCSGCEKPLPVRGVAAPTPAVAAEVKAPDLRPWQITWTLLCLGFLLLAGLILWMRPQPDDAPLAAQLDRIEQKLQFLEVLVNSQQRTTNADRTAVSTRLDALDGKLADQLAAAALQTTEAKTQRDQIARVETQLDALAQRAFAPPAPPGPLEIKVSAQGWNDAVPENVQAVCLSAANEIWQHVPDRRVEPITVSNSPKGPIVLFGRGPDGERRVQLNIKGKVWAQCGYQFSHEFCHILCNYRDVKNANLWFEESLCETASLFTLRRMARTWEVKPPYVNWKSYSDALTDYADEITRTTPAHEGLAFAAWFAKNEPAMRQSGVDRANNRIVAVALLKLLERDPHHWQAVGYLNQWDAKDSDQTLAQYLSDWRRRVPRLHQPFVRDVAKLFEIDIQ